MNSLEHVQRIHIVGAGGAGMSALAKILSSMGYTVTGSDLRQGPALAMLNDLGLETWTGSDPDRIGKPDIVVASSAVPDGDRELSWARAHDLTVWRRPDLLDALTARMPAIGATGTHGKTSSTALLIDALRNLDLDPSFVIGGELSDLRTNAHLGSSPSFVLEADEAFGTFLRLHLQGLMVTSVEAEHLDHFGSVYQLEDAFVEVVRKVDGPVVACGDDPGARRIAERTGVKTYGLSVDADWHIADVEELGTAVSFRLRGPAGSHAVELSRPGIHMARNAAGALALLAELGHDVDAMSPAFSVHNGVRRRFELKGAVAGVTIIDDYAHHPTEVAATVRTALRGDWNRVWAVFQPHLYSRTARFHREFGLAFNGCDHVVVTDVFGAREAPQPGITGRIVADAARALTEADVTYIQHRGDLAPELAKRVEPGDLVLTMGAGDITLLGDELSALLAGE